MNSKRIFFVMIGALVLSFGLLIGAVVFGDSLLKKKSSDLMALKVESRALDTQQTALAQAKKDVQKYSELEKTAKTIVPQDKDQAKTAREIVKIAEESDISISSINFPSSSLGQSQPAASSSASTSSSSSTSGSSTAKPATPPITQVKPVDGISGVYQMEITVASDTRKPIPYSSLVDFLSKLENNRRTAQVSNITVTPSPTSKGLVTFTLGINVFIKP